MNMLFPIILAASAAMLFLGVAEARAKARVCLVRRDSVAR